MRKTQLQAIVDAVTGRAHIQGSISAEEIRYELAQAGLPEDLWEDVVALAGPTLRRRKKDQYVATASASLRHEEHRLRAIQRAVRQILRQQRREKRAADRRQHRRVAFVQPVSVQGEDGRSYTFLSRDLSLTGIRLIGTCNLLGQKVYLLIPRGSDSQRWRFLVRILWTSAIGGDWFESGGTFLEVTEEET